MTKAPIDRPSAASTARSPGRRLPAPRPSPSIPSRPPPVGRAAVETVAGSVVPPEPFPLPLPAPVALPAPDPAVAVAARATAFSRRAFSASRWARLRAARRCFEVWRLSGTGQRYAARHPSIDLAFSEVTTGGRRSRPGGLRSWAPAVLTRKRRDREPGGADDGSRLGHRRGQPAAPLRRRTRASGALHRRRPRRGRFPSPATTRDGPARRRRRGRHHAPARHAQGRLLAQREDRHGVPQPAARPGAPPALAVGLARPRAVRPARGLGGRAAPRRPGC